MDLSPSIPAATAAPLPSDPGVPSVRSAGPDALASRAAPDLDRVPADGTPARPDRDPPASVGPRLVPGTGSPAEAAMPPAEERCCIRPSVTGAPETGAEPRGELAAGEFGPLSLPAGLPGFPEARAFRLRRLPGAGDFAMLESLEPEGPRFVVLEVAEPEAVFGPAATAEAAAALGIETPDLLLLAIVTLADGPAGRRAHVNLRAPVAVDRVGRTARQLVLADPRLPLRHPLEPRAAA